MGAGNSKAGSAQAYTAEGPFATNKDSGGSLKIHNAVCVGMCANQRQSQTQSQQESDELTERLEKTK